MSAAVGVSAFTLSYAVAYAATPFQTHANRYRAYSDGETVLCVPVAAAPYMSMQKRTEHILRESKTLVTDGKMPAETYIYTPGPVYRAAGVFARDFLYQLEGAGRDTVTADEVRRVVDFIAARQLSENRIVGPFTFPKGAIPDHVYPDGRYSWGPGVFYGDVNGHFNRPSMDEAMCFVTLAWHYGYKAGWDAAWQSWFTRRAPRFVDAWNSARETPRRDSSRNGRRPATAEPTASRRPMAMRHVGLSRFLRLAGRRSGYLGASVQCRRALADMHDHAADSAAAKTWSMTADAMRRAIQAQFHADGYLPWGVAQIPHDGLARHHRLCGLVGYPDGRPGRCRLGLVRRAYAADKAAGGAADLFQMTVGLRGRCGWREESG